MDINLTEQQKLALIDYHNNTLISAGAGSGKTRVLTIRIINYLLKGIDINNLLVLTFTKAAASEMKSRIRDGIKNEPSLQEQMLKVESAPITNFDAFYLSFIKKYCYLLNIDKNINIGDSSFFLAKKTEILTNIFDDLFLNNDEDFYDVLRNNSEKDDKVIFKDILTMFDKLAKKPNFDQYLDELKNKNFKNNDLDYYNKYMDEIFKYQSKIKRFFVDMEEKSHLEKNNFDDLISYTDYDDFISFFEGYKRFPTIKTSASLTDKEINNKINELVKNIRALLVYENKDELIKELYYSQNHSHIFYKILKELNKQLMEYKHSINTYEFDDIAKMMITLLENNEHLRKDYQSRFYEILVDEYQDTNDIQERILQLLSNNNVYMVGDIKQSIYRFRNANCEIFKNKYLNYENNNGGVKVDMNYNFRSRKAIIDNINIIFDNVMDLKYGGADYIKSHHMEAKNSLYFNEGKKDESDCLQILSYDKEDIIKHYGDNPTFTYEALIIAKDIKNKVEQGYKVVKNKLLQPVSYKDFAIITRSKTHHKELKEVFEYFNIPLYSYTNEDMTSISFISVIKSLLNLYKCIYNNDISSATFRHTFLSVGRSCLFSYTDQELYDMIIPSLKDKDYSYIKNSDIYIKMKYVIDNYKFDSNVNIFNSIVNTFDLYNNIIRDVDVLDSNTVIANTFKMIESTNNALLSFIEFIDYFSLIIDKDFKLSYESSKLDSDSVTLTNIHKSKGLEYKIIYFFNLDAKFNESDIKSRYLFDDEYGFVIENNRNCPLKLFVKNKEKQEIISEEIRLFYVALTRANENLIFVTSLKFDEENFELKDKETINRYNDLLVRLTPYFNANKMIKYVREEYPNDFLKETTLNEFVNDFNLINKTIDIPYKEIEKGHASNVIKEIIDKDTYRILNEGTKFHEIMENIDFKNPDYSNLSPFYVKKINSFIDNLKNINININDCEIFQEHEFYINIENKEINGIIDLLIMDKDKIVVIDYKLSNASVEKYRKQLEVYYSYVKLFSNKPCYTYLYSLLQEEFKEVVF